MLIATPRVMPARFSRVEKIEGSWITVWGLLAGLAAVAVEMVNRDVAELGQQPLAHDDG